MGITYRKGCGLVVYCPSKRDTRNNTHRLGLGSVVYLFLVAYLKQNQTKITSIQRSIWSQFSRTVENIPCSSISLLDLKTEQLTSYKKARPSLIPYPKPSECSAAIDGKQNSVKDFHLTKKLGIIPSKQFILSKPITL